MADSFNGWVSNWNVGDSIRNIFDSIHEKATAGAVAGAWSGMMGGPGGIVGAAAVGAAGGIVVGLITGVTNEVEAVLEGTASGKYTWAQVSSRSYGTSAITPLGTTNESDGSITHAFKLYDGSTVRMNTTTKLMSFTGTSASDHFAGKSSTDRYNGGAGDDFIYGHDGADSLAGSLGRDYISGGKGNDQIYGSAGVDTLYGGLGNDTFHFPSTNTLADRDYVGDFRLEYDQIDTDFQGLHHFTGVTKDGWFYLTDFWLGAAQNHVHLDEPHLAAFSKTATTADINELLHGYDVFA